MSSTVGDELASDDPASVAGMGKALSLIADGYRGVDGSWPGFVPNEHPVVLAYKDGSGTLVAALAINHPEPDALGDATALDVEGLPFTSAHRIENPTDREKLESMPTFDFHATLGGIDSFAMNAGGSDRFFDPLTVDYASTLLHEMFHRYQDDAFEGDIGSQDVDGYAYTATNLELAALEERALSEALTASDDADRELAARRFAGLRLARRAADDRVVLDDSQERFEGTARFIEHKLAGDNTDYSFNNGNYEGDLLTDLEPADVKNNFGFGRFYASGSAALRVAELLGVEDLARRIEADQVPADILIDHLGVTDAEAADLAADARRAYDPLGELPAAAEAAAEQAANEPDPFGETPGGDGGSGPALDDDELECLEELGVDVAGEELELTKEQYEACLA